MPELAQYAVGQLAIRLKVLPLDLHIHRSRESEVEDLSSHIRGQKVERSPGKAGGKIFEGRECKWAWGGVFR